MHKYDKYEVSEEYEDLFDDAIILDSVELHEYRGNTMKTNLFIKHTLKKQKISKEVINQFTFGDINELRNSLDGVEGYLGAYSDLEYFSYRYRKLHGIYPDAFRLKNINSLKFVKDLINTELVLINSYYKTYSEENEEIGLDSFVLCIKNYDGTYIYLYLDFDEAYILYNKKNENDDKSSFHLLLSILNNYVEPTVTKNKIYIVYQTNDGFQKTGFDIKKINVDLEENYNDGFIDVSKEIINGLNNKNKTNLVILSGEPGTGKTSFIRYLTSKIKKNIIFIAPDMVDHITDPSFIPFLIKNNDAVLIIEDAEPALQHRDGQGRTSAVSNILNLTDGLLSDCLNISIVATFNTSSKDIDSALLRKGRLLMNYKFDKLSVEKSKKLLEKLGKTNIEVKEPMTLADIYFYEHDNNSKEYKPKKIGFGNQ